MKKLFRLVNKSSGDKEAGGGGEGLGGVLEQGASKMGGAGGKKGMELEVEGRLPSGWEGGGKSFFNGLWASRGFTDRFFLSYSAIK